MSMFDPFGIGQFGYLNRIGQSQQAINQNIYQYLETQSLLASRQHNESGKSTNATDKNKQQLLLLTTGE